MRAIGIKSFIFSFIFALLAVLSVDKLFLHTQNQSTPAKKISYKNIALFSEDKDLIVASTEIQNINKQELSADIEQYPSVANNGANSHSDNTGEIMQIAQNDISVMSEENLEFDEEEQLKNLPVELSFEEVMAQNNLDIEENYEQIAQNDNSTTNSSSLDDTEQTPENIKEINKADYILADTSLDENINLWMPLEQGTVDATLADNASSQIAMSGSDAMISSVIETQSYTKAETLDDAIVVAKTAGNSAEKETKDLNDPTWVVAKGAKYTKNKLISRSILPASSQDLSEQTKDANNENMSKFSVNKLISSEETKSARGFLRRYPDDKKGVNVAYKVMDNILIPLPDDILEDDNLTPQLVASDEQKTSIKKDTKADNETKTTEKKQAKKQPAEKQTKKKTSLLKSIGAFFGVSNKDKTEDYEEFDVSAKTEDISEDYTEQEGNDEDVLAEEDLPIKKKTSSVKKTHSAKILPAEMKLSFQPGRAEISGTTLRWLRAFAKNINENDDLYIEIRIGRETTAELQQKRLNLLYGIFIENDVDFNKIKTIFTEREPNSFVIRNLNISNNNNNKEVKKKKQNKKKIKTYYQTW